VLNSVVCKFSLGLLLTARQGIGSQRNKAILTVRAKVLDAARFWLGGQGFVEVQGPVLLPAVGDRPHNFRVNYFDQSAYLSGGLQPYSDVFIEMFEKVYTVAPTFRAEPLKTKRHLAEFWRIEVAGSGFDLEQMLRVQEEMVAHICSELSKDAVEELCFLRGSTENLNRVNAPFPRITYDEAIEKLQKAKHRIQWGEELSWEMEHELSLMFDRPFFVTDFPVSGETYFHKSNPVKPELSLCADLVAPEGYGEISSAGETITDKKELLRKIREIKIEPTDRRWYLSLRRFGSSPKSGFALGVERFLQWVCKLENVEEAAAFARTYERIYP
jgi:asparaginyl-tRNA synthetase